MKIKLNNLKIAEFASHETTCFQAMLNVDGYDVALVENDGQGGCHKYTLMGDVKDSSLTRNKVLFGAVEKYAIKLDPKGFEQLDALVYSMMEA